MSLREGAAPLWNRWTCTYPALPRNTPFQPLFPDAYLLAAWSEHLEAYGEEEDRAVLEQLQEWSGRDRRQVETQLEGSFVETILCRLLGFWTTGGTAAGTRGAVEDWNPPGGGYTALPQYPVPNAGQTGGTGFADIALGLFSEEGDGVAQVLGEFKDIRSGLDVRQNRKGNQRTPVGQCFDYLRHKFDQTPIESVLKPTWGLATNMEEFRLYCRSRGQAQCQRFVVDTTDLLEESDRGRRRRFLFREVLSPRQLLARHGRSPLLKLLHGQLVLEKNLERKFYLEYSALRKRVHGSIVAANPEFSGTRGELVTLTQRFLDRCLFVLFCEDMGRTVGFPPKLLQDLLSERSRDRYFGPDHSTIWAQVQELFRAMRDGGPFPPDHDISRFNGGLFAESPALDGLQIPNKVFCASGQGTDAKSLAADKETLLYLAANYNFGEETAEGGDGEVGRTITLYTLGRIFEQSITELEHLHAEAEGRATAASLSKRKRNGVYYTPEWVTTYIVEETVGRRLRDAREALGLQLGVELPEEELARYRGRRRGATGRTIAPRVVEHLDRLQAYRHFVDHIKILDPSCGSGAFLICALLYLRQHRRDIQAEEGRVTGSDWLFDADEYVRHVLSNNLYGVDLNPESVEITQLALWLHTAKRGEPLTTLDEHIRCGNSLVGPDFAAFYQRRHEALFDELTPDEQERVNMFDWTQAFPEVLGEGVPDEDRGFDCIIGNPPYVKLQHMRRMREDEVAYLVDQTTGTDRLYRSTQTGNFDLYLPFIEQGVRLLSDSGRMGLIAPNVWLKNEYGEALRRLVAADGVLDRWVDFGHYQVFDDVTVYTALQFFRKQGAEGVAFHRVEGNELGGLEWGDGTPTLHVAEEDSAEPWLLLTEDERRLYDRLNHECLRLDDERVSSSISVGIQTSADSVYHLKRVAPGRYFSEESGAEVAVEDELMRPLVSGEEAKRYQLPSTETYLLFPYDLTGAQPRLFSVDEMGRRFPMGWAYLQAHEERLRARESRKMDVDGGWWAYNYPKNLGKQERAKLGVAQTVPSLRVFADARGEFFFNNVRVNAIHAAVEEELFYLLGVMNSSVADWFFKKVAKVKDGGYFEANKQFIAPIPIPYASDEEKSTIAAMAEACQQLVTRHRDEVEEFEARLDSDQCVLEEQQLDWIWADTSMDRVERDAPGELGVLAKRRWVKAELQRRTDRHYEPIDAVLRAGVRLTVVEDGADLFLELGELRLLSLYGVGEEAAFIACQWRHRLRTKRITTATTAKELVALLLALKATGSAGLRASLVERDQALLALEAEVRAAEAELDASVRGLYGIMDEELAVMQSP